MSYKLSLFAFAQDVPDEAILDNLAGTVDALSADIQMGDAYATLRLIEGLKFCQVLALDRSPGSGVMRGTATDGLYWADFASAFLGYDDQNGVYLFDYWDPASKTGIFLLSDGPLIGGTLDRIESDYPQKGYSNDDLQALFEKDEAELTPAEYAAIAEYQNAIDIGLAERFGWKSGRKFLDLCHVDTGYNLFGAREEVPLPDGLRNLIGFWPEFEDLQRAGIPDRIY